jgi:enamine deaminase RidA (YjgF/YER057c/UK114 family)
MTVKLFTPPTLPFRGYSQVCEVTSGKLILIAGQVPHDVDDKLVGEGDFDAQVEQVFKNLGRALEGAGGSFKNLVKINNYCVETVSYEPASTTAPSATATSTPPIRRSARSSTCRGSPSPPGCSRWMRWP